MSPEREAEFTALLAFLVFYKDNISKPPSNAQLNVVDEVARIAKQFGKSKALAGLRQAVNDVVEHLSGLTPDSVVLLDQALRAAGVKTLSEVRNEYGSAFKKMLKRGYIKTETEYYMVNSLVVDPASGISLAERQSLDHMLTAYEGQIKQASKPSAKDRLSR